jgi:hypothetical protein
LRILPKFSFVIFPLTKDFLSILTPGNSSYDFNLPLAVFLAYLGIFRAQFSSKNRKISKGKI